MNATDILAALVVCLAGIAVMLSAKNHKLMERNKVLEDACEILRRQNERMYEQMFSDGKPKREEDMD